MGIASAQIAQKPIFFIYSLVQQDCLTVLIAEEREILFGVIILPIALVKCFLVLHLSFSVISF